VSHSIGVTHRNVRLFLSFRFLSGEPFTTVDDLPESLLFLNLHSLSGEPPYWGDSP